ncbi:7-carboxy-7-deazaguanine synthase QueE [Paenibacillus sp. IB182496]|uniref:7-carboxy-7-deazaguanine synthase n=2 Tax=Paenibacillus sabuli TaxID=2772509 RepID=A0A927BSC1_9BACL|nr:7-carboxy-7-deazaguanine synthase QueE [Paenibacillus sabuli]
MHRSGATAHASNGSRASEPDAHSANGARAVDVTLANNARSTGQERFPVLEIFGPTVQGEGRVIGRKTLFVRTAGCDYACAWCDSAFTWDGSAKDEIERLDAAQIVERLAELGGEAFAHVTLSGGNPALLPGLGELIDVLHARGAEVALETQGSRWQDWFVRIDQLTLSPKPPSSGMETDWARLDDILSRLEGGGGGGEWSLKVVVFDEIDLDYAIRVHERYPDVSFYVQPGNADLTEPEPARMLSTLAVQYEALVQRIMDEPRLQRVSVLPQLHTWLWGNKRGV